MSVTKTSTGANIPFAPWTIKDLLIAACCPLLSALCFYFLLLVSFGDTKITLRVARYVGSLIMIFFPLYWLKRQYGLSKEAIGLRKGELSLWSHIFIGVIMAIIYSLTIQLTPLKYSSASPDLKSYPIGLLIIAPLSINGFASIILAPLSEEIVYRGVIYGYLRTKLKMGYALILQALLFCFLHYNGAYSNALNLLIHQ